MIGTILQETQCLSNCSEGFYENKEKKLCSKCHPSCLTCNGPNSDQVSLNILKLFGILFIYKLK